jgi:C1A family cysteine protease
MIFQPVLNCIPSSETESDWDFSDALDSGIFNDNGTDIPESVDLRARWWKVDDQKDTGACVGYATAYGLLRWHYVNKGIMAKNQKPSARFIWMANKETDEITDYPSTFLENEGTQTKHALHIARKFGCVVDNDLPMKGRLSSLRAKTFYARASQYRISSYYNLGLDLVVWKRWLAFNGPILTRLDVDNVWMSATQTNGILGVYDQDSRQAGHAVCLVGYTRDHFIIRNSWGKNWGDMGFAYASNQYSSAAFTEAYGIAT